MGAVVDVVRRLAAKSDGPALLQATCDALAGVLEGGAWIWQAQGDGLRIVAEAGGGPDTGTRRQERDLGLAALRTRVGRLGTDGRLAAVPVVSPASLLGVLLLRPGGIGRFWSADLPALEALGLAVGSAASVLDQASSRLAADSALRPGRGSESTAGLALVTPDGRILDANAAFCATTGYPRGELLARRLFDITPAEDREAVVAAGERRIQRANGTVAWATVSPMGEEDPPRMLAVEIPDAERSRLAEEEAKRRSDQHVAIALVGRRALGGLAIDALFRDAAGLVARGLRVELGSVLELAADGRTLLLRAGHGFPAAQAAVESDAGAQAQDHYAFSAGGPVVVEDLADPDSFDPAPVLVQQGAVCGISVAIAADGQPFGILGGHAKRARRFLPEDLHFVEAVANVLAAAVVRHRSQEAIVHQATHDGLTGLANRALLEDHIATAISRAHRRQHLLALYFMDLDRFKLVNDSLGHAAGDAVLRQAADRLRATLRAEDTIARVGGDEFVALCEDLSGTDEVAIVAERLVAALAEPFRVGDRDIYALGSIGVAVDQGRGDTESLLADADTAMYRAKASGRGRWVLFTPEMRADLAGRIETEAALHAAVERREFRLAYQPILDLASGSVSGAEALLAWQHPERGLLPAAEFLPLAQEAGLIVPLGLWALERACMDAATWPEGRVDVHLFAGQLADPRLVAGVAGALAASGLPPERLCLEMAESFLVGDPPAAVSVLGALAGLGVRLAVDDIGTGYASLAHLRRFPLHELKVDPSFVAALGPAPEDSAIVAAVVSLGRILGLRCVAEGVETAEQLALVRDLGCQGAQGPYVGEAVGAEGFLALLSGGGG